MDDSKAETEKYKTSLEHQVWAENKEVIEERWGPLGRIQEQLEEATVANYGTI